MKTAFLLLLVPAALLAQFADGVVYDALTGAPLPGAYVSIQDPNSPATRTDASGHFHIQLPANYPRTIVAAKPGYLQTYQAAKTAENTRIELKPEAVITGKIIDEDGFPAGGAQLHAMRYQTVRGHRDLVFSAMGQSDERGEYRIDGLQPGQYYIRVHSSDAANWDARYVAQYLGGTLKPADSHIVEVKTGEIRKDVDIQLVRFEGVTVTGRVDGVTPNPRAPSPMNIILTSDQSMGFPAPTSIDREMNFTIRHVPPGSYTLRYGPQYPRAGEMAAQVPVEVADHDVRDLVLAPHTVQAVDLEGHVQVREGGAPGPWIVYLRPRMGTGVSAHTLEDGSFTVKGLLPEHYAVEAMPERHPTDTMTSAGYVVAIALGDQDVQEKGFDLDGTPQPKALTVLISNRYANLSGTIVDSQGAPVANAGVIFQSSQPSHGGYTATDDKGNFHATLSGAGDYHVFVTDQDAALSPSGDDYFAAHQGDFPLVHVALGDNPPVRLVRKAR